LVQFSVFNDGDLFAAGDRGGWRAAVGGVSDARVLNWEKA